MNFVKCKMQWKEKTEREREQSEERRNRREEEGKERADKGEEREQNMHVGKHNLAPKGFIVL